ncbi:hypothetical protein P615_10365 [Brevibacillus laterosporus PE36]|nr:hypothetical protein P615_10365 [Brevibacillus laterosporus PE36]
MILLGVWGRSRLAEMKHEKAFSFIQKENALLMLLASLFG